ncbi:cysteine hydrolase family protein [Brevibacillus invocatus]|uniref:cysteine hydrolase family protein n=1 Tax=Brevibacillus invocatus TaxID=173959 RepID=UPI00203BBCF9|nr:cysteine hydrolase family protein [Brevibacillus invocatus]MCM3079742.1 cysteine hydrolase [Brevibacillus invocatus]MCM3429936.1 cysteine hydrolase [Brevibacillus invocatus]
MGILTNAALILIDVQNHFDDPAHGRRNNPHAEEKMATLLHRWRKSNLPVIHIQHISNPSLPHHPGRDIKEIVAPLPGEQVMIKHVNSSFIGTNLEGYLREAGIETLVIVGLTTDHCVSTTTRMAKNLGFNPFLVSDATATFERISFDGNLYLAEDIHHMALVSLHDEFATVIDTNGVLQLLEG